MFDLMTIPATISTVLWVVLLALKGFALGDAIFRPTDAYPAADKQNKPFWLLILGLAFLVQVLPPFADPLNFLNIASTVGAIVYLVGVRPALRHVGGARRKGGRKGGTTDGPYGPW